MATGNDMLAGGLFEDGSLFEETIQIDQLMHSVVDRFFTDPDPADEKKNNLDPQHWFLLLSLNYD